MKITEKKTLVGAIVGIAVLYATIYYGGLAWKRSQEGKGLI
jgi:hypothetical protein